MVVGMVGAYFFAAYRGRPRSLDQGILGVTTR